MQVHSCTVAFRLKIFVGAFIWACLTSVAAQTPDPIKIGFSMSLTGGSASSGKAALLAMKIWEEDVNAKGGLLGRPVKLIYYDDQSSPAGVPAIYTKLLDVDKVDLVVGPYGTITTAPAMPVVMQRNKVLISLVALAVNQHFNYDKYFAMIALGPQPTIAFSKGFFETAAAQDPKPKTVAMVGADTEFTNNNLSGARENAKAAGLTIVYDKTYPPSTTDFSPIVRAVRATNPDLFYVASYPADSVGILRAVDEIGFKPKMLGGSMVGLQAASLKMQLGPLLNGVVTYENWLPVSTMMFQGVMDMLKKYQARAASEGVDLLGYGWGPPAYAYLQVLGDAVAGTNSLDDAKIAQFIRANMFKTVWGDIRFGPSGDWVEGRQLFVQYRNITGSGLDQFTDPSKVVILYPPAFKTGDVAYPYGEVKK